MIRRGAFWPGLLVAAGSLASIAGTAQAQSATSIEVVSAAYANGMSPHIVAGWISETGDAGGRPFIIVDKLSARVLAFDGEGKLVGETNALLGMAVGDVSPPGIGEMRLADIGPAMRITPAGRFDAHLGRNLAGSLILWVDYDEALSLHPVVTSNASEQRQHRLSTPTPLDNRISFGCINVPAAFFTEVVVSLFESANGLVYILPDDPSGGIPLSQ